MQAFLKAILALLPMIFAIGFIAPVIAQSIDAMGIAELLGVSALLFGLLVAGAWGLIAQVTGRWI